MLLLVTIGLVLVGAVSLVIGFVSNSLPPIYLSIACSVIAGIVLVVFSRMSKRQEAGGPSATGFKPAPSPGTWTPPPPPPAPSYRAPATPPPAPEPEPAASAAASSAVASAVAVEDFPIEGYETLRVSQILPALDGLDLDDLDIVREREEQGKNRTTVLRRIDVLMDEREAQDGAAATGVTTPLEPEMGDDGEDDGFIEDHDDDDLLDDDLGAAEADRTEILPAAATVDDSFPIPNYDNLPVAQILPLLEDLDDDELDIVAEHEEQGKNRAAILDRIDDMFEPLDDQAPAPLVIPAPRAPAKRAPAKKAPAKKAPAKKAVAVKSTGAKKAPARTAAVKKASVKKAALVEKPSPVKGTKGTKGAKKAAPAKRTPAAVKKVAKKR